MRRVVIDVSAFLAIFHRLVRSLLIMIIALHFTSTLPYLIQYPIFLDLDVVIALYLSLFKLISHLLCQII